MACRIVVVSAIFGGRDRPIYPPAHDVADYVLFTDGDDAPGWRTIQQDPTDSPRLAARRVKTLALDLIDDGDIVLWIDGRIRPTGLPLAPILEATLAGADIASYPHPWRSCAYAEAQECVALGLAPASDIAAQTARYEAEGFPRGRGLWNTMVLARRRTDEMVELGREWWHEIQHGSIRDQVSFPFVLWQRDQRCTAIGADVYRKGSSPYFERGRHARSTD